MEEIPCGNLLYQRELRTFKRHGVPLYLKPTNTMRQLLVHPKDKLHKEMVVVHHIPSRPPPPSTLNRLSSSLNNVSSPYSHLEHGYIKLLDVAISYLHNHIDHPI